MKHFFIFFCIASFVLAAPVTAQSKDKANAVLQDVLSKYFFVNDFERKIPDRDISSEHLFWRYPYKIGNQTFTIEFDLHDIDKELPITMGEGRPYHHLNAGRAAFLNGEYLKARDIWMEGRSKYKTEYPHHRRTDYFIGLAYLKLADESLKANEYNYDDPNTRTNFKNAASFLSWALFKKEDVKDPLFPKITPKQSYNMAAIYYRYQRYAAAFGAAKKGLDFLRAEGLQAYHTPLTRIQAEAFIQNRSYLEAIQSYDVTLRHKPSPEEAAAIFARVGDIYFDLNNYEIAAINYQIARRIMDALGIVDTRSLLFLAESLFWRGNIAEANKVFRYALAFIHSEKAGSLVTQDIEEYGRLRLADTYLALNELPRAKAQYYDLGRNFRDQPSGRTARIRGACLDLPYFDGNNVMHAREALASIKYDDIAPQARELAWACEVASYAERDRTLDMLERIRVFYKEYPRSRFLESLIKPVEDVRKQKLHEYLDNRDFSSALAYYQKYKNLLFKEIDVPTAQKLFRAALDASDLGTAKQLYPLFDKDLKKSELDTLRKILYLSETADQDKATNKDGEAARKFARNLERNSWQLKRSPYSKNLIHRILDTKNADHNLVWIYNLMQGWDISETSETCNEQYPLMSKIYRKATTSQATKNLIAQKSSSLSLQLLPQLFSTDEPCAIALLNFEYEVNKNNPRQLIDRYLGRLEWPLTEEFTYLLWNVSETAREKGFLKEARLLWQTIVRKAPKTSPQIAFAKSRLDTTRSEFEDLWK